MIVFLYGGDLYRREEKRRAVLLEFRKKYGGSSTASFSTGTEKELSKADGEALRAFVRNRPLFGGKQCAAFHVEAYGMLSKQDAAFLKEAASADDILIVVTSDASPAKACAFLAEPPCIFQKFEALPAAEYRAHVSRHAAACGLRLTDGQIDLLRALHGDDMWGVVTEIDMLSLGDAGTRVISRSEKTDFMGTLRALANGDARQKIPALLRLARENDAAKTFNVLAATVYGEKKRLFADHDIAIKRGLSDYDLALTDFALQ